MSFAKRYTLEESIKSMFNDVKNSVESHPYLLGAAGFGLGTWADLRGWTPEEIKSLMDAVHVNGDVDEVNNAVLQSAADTETDTSPLNVGEEQVATSDNTLNIEKLKKFGRL
jgi:hypothetical protein